METRKYNIIPISTSYKGITYRSQLEAKWAAFFNNASIPFQYEKEQYRLGTTTYLPDFFLPNCPYRIVEIKPDRPTIAEMHKCRQLSHQRNVAIFAGPPTLGQFQIHLFEQGQAFDIDTGYLFTLKCLVRGLQPDIALNLIRLKAVLGQVNNKKLYNAFE